MSSRFSYSRTPAAADLGAIAVVIQRRTGNDYATIGADEKVLPGESLRAYVTGIGFFTDSVQVTIVGSGGLFLDQSVNRAVWDGVARLDFTAPTILGAYQVTVRSQQLGTDYAYTAFLVSTDAPPPPKPPPGGFYDIFDPAQLQKLLLIGGGLILAIAAVNAFGRRR